MSTPPTLRVVVADDHAPFRDIVRTALEGDGCEVVAEVATSADAVAACEEHRPDVALLDIHMPGSGIRAAAEIGLRLPETAVVMLTSSEDQADLFDALRAGANGYLLKGSDAATLATHLRAALAGEAQLSPKVLNRVLDEFRAPARPRFRRGTKAASRLSPREWEVMELLADGASTDDVAARLFLSTTTVRVHVSSVLKKLRVSSREEAVQLLREQD